MKILKSGAKNKLVPQNDSYKSLGGWVSSSEVISNKLNSLFGSVSLYDLKNPNDQFIGVFLNNEQDVNFEDLVIECFYERKFGIKKSDYKFSFAVTEVNDGYMQRIGSIETEPDEVNWFDCETKLNNCIIKINRPGNINDEFSIFGEVGVFTTNDKRGNLLDILQTLKNSNVFSGELIDDANLFIEQIVGFDNLQTDFLTDGLCEIVDVETKDGFDGKTLICENFPKNKFIGLWIRRSFEPNSNSDKNSKKETFNIKLHYTEETEIVE